MAALPLQTSQTPIQKYTCLDIFLLLSFFSPSFFISFCAKSSGTYFILGNRDGANSASSRALAWSGYRVSRRAFKVFLFFEVKLQSLPKTPLAIALKQEEVWLLPLFRYFSFWFGFMWILNRRSPWSFQKRAMSKKGKYFPSMTFICSLNFVTVGILLFVGLHISAVNFSSLDPTRSSTLSWKVLIHLVMSSVDQFPSKNTIPSSR